MAITAWGDNDQTTFKDGFAEGELIRFKIWDSQAGKEYNAIAQYSQGGTTYATNGIYVLSSLVGITSVSHSIVLPAGWNMISSYVAPKDSTIDTVFNKIKSHVVIMKNGLGQVYWPSLSINTIGKWNPVNGYQIYMQSNDTLTLSGNEINPQQMPMALPQGWNMVSYLRNSPMRADSALGSFRIQSGDRKERSRSGLLAIIDCEHDREYALRSRVSDVFVRCSNTHLSGKCDERPAKYADEKANLIAGTSEQVAQALQSNECEHWF